MAESNSEGRWSTGLCDCFSDIRVCCMTMWCPCITFGQVSEILDRGSSSCGLNAFLFLVMEYSTRLPGLYSCFYRTKLRKQYSLEEKPCCDCCVHFFCYPCALCQEYRELQNRGIDISAGWAGNPHLHNQGVAMAPVMEGAMKR